MEKLEFSGKTLEGLGSLNIVLGKNGCGKSTILKEADTALRQMESVANVRYISPERGGVLKYAPNIDNNITENPNWLFDTRRQNQASSFKAQTAALYRRLELAFLRDVERDQADPNLAPRYFDEIISRINELLERITIKRSGETFEFVQRDDDKTVTPESISSGESELISLAIEVISFAAEVKAGDASFLLFDEPDVHLHPDLQDRFARFIVNELKDKAVVVIIATHSTPLVSALSRYEGTRISFMRRGMNQLTFEDVKTSTRAVLPMFGAHPLSNVFNESPILLVEGEDDTRIWGQAARSSAGTIRLFPCAAGSVDVLNEYEKSAQKIIESVYDRAIGYSLRDRDDNPEDIEDLPPVVRMRLSCRAAENLMLSDDALALAGIDWGAMTDRLSTFVIETPHHPYHSAMKAFVDGALDRKNHNLKEIRNVVVGLMTDKPWEVLVGQAIARARLDQTSGAGSMRDFLGEKAWARLVMRQTENAVAPEPIEVGAPPAPEPAQEGAAPA